MSSLRVVVVDDVAAVRELIASVFVVQAGHELAGEAADGLAGVTVVLEQQPDLVIMDWQMPELDGVEATRRIHASLPELPVVAYSSAEAAAIRDAFLAAGAFTYVEKTDIAGLERAIA